MRFGFKFGFGFKASGAYLSQAVLSMEIGVYSETTIQTTASTVSFVGIPSWLTYDSGTKVLSGTPDGTQYGWEKFDVLLNGTTTITDGLTLIIAEAQGNISTKLSGNVPAITNLLGSEMTSTNTSMYQLLHDGVGNWDYFTNFYYYTNHVIIIDSDGSTVNQTDANFHLGTSLNTSIARTAITGYTFIANHNKGEVYRYDHAIPALELVQTLPHISTNHANMSIGLDDRLVFARGGVDGQIRIMEIENFSPYALVNTYTLLATDASHTCAADTTHVYYVTAGAGGEYNLYSYRRSDGNELLLSRNSNWTDMTQTRYGIYIYINAPLDGLATGYYWLYNGALKFAGSSADLETLYPAGIPWSTQPAGVNVYGSFTSAVDDSNKPYEVDNSQIAPLPGTTSAYLWVKQLQASAYARVEIPNINMTSIPYSISTKIGDSIMMANRGYAGYMFYDTILESWQQTKFFSNPPSAVIFVEVGNDLWFLGYPNNIVQIKKPSGWSVPDITLAPDAQPALTNPIYIGSASEAQGALFTAGSTGGGHHGVTAGFEDKYGRVWSWGDYRRDGTGLGGTRIIDNGDGTYTALGYRVTPAFETIKPTDGVATDNYSVVTCFSTSVDTVTLVCVHLDTDAITYITLPIAYNAGGRILKIEGDKVIIATALLADDTLAFVGIDVSNGTVLFENTTDIATGLNKAFDQFNRQSNETLRKIGENIYFNNGSNLMFIDKYSGRVIRNKEITSGESFIENNNKIYLADSGTTDSVADYLMTTTLQPLDILPLAAHVSMNKTTIPVTPKAYTVNDMMGKNDTSVISLDYNTGDASLMTMQLQSGVFWDDVSGVTTGDNSGIVSDYELEHYFLIDGAEIFRLTGTDGNYKITVVSASSSTSTGRNMEVIIGATTKIITHVSGVPSSAVFDSVAMSGGILDINIAPEAGSTYCYLNSIVIEPL